MKRNCILKVAMLVALVMVGFTNVYSQEKGDMAAGANIVVGSYTDSPKGVDFGIGARFQYNVTKPIRLDGQFNYYFGEYAPLDFSVNAHYLINEMPKLNVYPLVGLSIMAFGGNGSGDCKEDYLHRVPGVGLVGCDEFNSDYGGNCPAGNASGVAGGLGFNLGGGAEYRITDKIFGTAELKYNVGFGFAISAGVAYKF
jgi:outer membrane protein X